MGLIVIIALVGGYFIGQFSAQIIEQDTTTTITQTETKTSTLIRKITETYTRTLQVPSNSKAIIRSHLIFDGSILVTFSIDKPTYSIGEIVHIKTTITNLTPNDWSFNIGGSIIEVRNSTKPVWTYPENVYFSFLAPWPGSEIDLLPGETKIIENWMTADWNMKGLHHSSGNIMDYWLPWNSTGISLIGNFYNDYFVSEGQYTVIWYTLADLGDTRIEIPFTITKQD